MLKNYFNTIIRNIGRNKVFSIINVVGLSLGLAAFIAINEYVSFEKSYDSYTAHSKDIFRLGLHANFGDGEVEAAIMGPPASRVIKADFPEVVDAIRIYRWFRRDYFVKTGDLELKEQNMTRLLADPNFFGFFGIPLVSGNEEEALKQPNSVVITESTANKYFGDNWRSEGILGKFFEMEGFPPLQLTGVSEDVPENTHFDYNFLISLNSVPEERSTSWLSHSMYQYFQLLPGTNRDQFLDKLQERAPDYINNDIEQFMGVPYSEFFSREAAFFQFTAQPLTDIHLDSNTELELEANGDRTYVTIFSIVSYLVLLMAAINFMNLTTVASLKRHKEVGVRKVLGSLRSQLIFQFLFESTLIVFVSLVLAITGIQLFAPIINSALEVQVIPGLNELLDSIVGLVLGALLLGILSGMYPALVLSAFTPGTALRGASPSRRGANLFRNGLILFQFSISLLLIIGVTGIFQQIEHLKTRDLGYDKDQIMIIEDVAELGDQGKLFRDRLVELAAVRDASFSAFVPIGSEEYGFSGYSAVDDPNTNIMRIRSAYADEHYLSTYSIPLLVGRSFNPTEFDDTKSIIVNEAMLKLWNWDMEDALGKRVFNVGTRQNMTIVGVMKDFQTATLKESMQPFFLEYASADQAISLSFTGENWQEVKTVAESLWGDLTNKPFSYTFASQMFESMMEKEQQASRLFSLFSVLAMLIGSLGLLGVASYVIVQRSKEVGIRKVLGASLPNLFFTLSKSFIWLVVLSGLVAIPIGYYLLKDWVSQYAYQISISWPLFVMPFLLIGLIALLIVGFQVLKVARVNPVKSLRYE